MEFTEKFMPATHHISLGFVVVTFSSLKKMSTRKDEHNIVVLMSSRGDA
jgi:hypothetical protein